MSTQLIPNRDTGQKSKINSFNVFRFLIVILLLLGVFFRFANIDRKIAWLDEHITSVRISDKYADKEKVKQMLNGQEITIKTFHQAIQANPQRSVIDVVKTKLVNHPEHPPLYYMLARLGVENFGDSVATTRSVAAFISLLVFPGIFWLCWELFGSPITAWVGVALIAVSPIHVLYAQEAREYSLWTVAILLSSAALLRAMRWNTKLSWITYAATVALGLYSHLFFTLVAIAQGIYVVITEGFRFSKTLIAYLLASVAGLIAFAPWMWVFISNLTGSSHLHKAASWTVQKPTLLTLVKRWVGNLSRVFIDFGFDEGTSSKDVLLFIPLILGVLILVGYSMYFIGRTTPKRVWLFVLTLIGVPTLALVGVDLSSGRLLSGTARYLFPLYVGVHLGVIYLLATKSTSELINSRKQKLWQLATFVLITSGIFSCVVSTQAQVWWSKGEAKHLNQIAPIINQATQPLVVSDTQLARVLSLSSLLKSEVRLQLVMKPNIPKIPNNSSNIFLFNPSDKLRQAKEQEYKLEPIYNKELQLWKLEKL